LWLLLGLLRHLLAQPFRLVVDLVFAHGGWDVGLVARLLLAATASSDDIPIAAQVLAAGLIPQGQGNGIAQSAGPAPSQGAARPTAATPLLGGSSVGVIGVDQEGYAEPNGQEEGHQLDNRRGTSSPDEGHLWFLGSEVSTATAENDDDGVVAYDPEGANGSLFYLCFPLVLSDLSFHLVRVQLGGRQHCVYATLIKAWQ